MKETIQIKEGSVHFWNDGDIIVCEEPSGGLEIRFKKDFTMEQFREIIRTHMYQESRHLFLVVPKGKDAYDGIDVLSYGPLARYLAPPDPKTVSESFAVSECSALLLLGPTGTGKSLLARHVAEALNGHSLTISGDILSNAPILIILMLVEILRPEVLILDDIPESDETRKKMLSITEALHENHPASKVILTLMTSGPVEEKRGAAYIEGLRPGRVDAALILNPPDEKRRVVFLQEYLAGSGKEHLAASLAKETVDLSPAYLNRLANQIRALPEATPEAVKRELTRLLLLAPPLKENPPPEKNKKKKGASNVPTP